MTGEPGDRDVLLGRLRQQARQLVAELPGPLRRVRLRSGETMVEVEWPEPAGGGAAAGGSVTLNGHATAAASSTADGAAPPGGTTDRLASQPDGRAAGGPSPAAAPAGPPDGGRDVVAPIVGTFYRAPEPGAEPFVQVGDLVEAGQVVGIVEAMKLMNQVTAETAGRVTAVLAGDGEPVQFGQPLIRLATA